jgi:hypothetical protein
MNVELSPLDEIPGLIRCENIPRTQAMAIAMERTHAVYPHDKLYGPFCTVQAYVDCPPEDAYAYLTDIRSLHEWTYSTRDFRPTEEDPELYVGWDTVEEDTRIWCKVVANPDALTVDYHCAWDQGRELWMIYLMRVVPAELVLKRPGCVITWTNCHHPYYDTNPWPELAPNRDRPWVGDLWDIFYAAHSTELENLKTILEYRHRNGLPVRFPAADPALTS